MDLDDWLATLDTTTNPAHATRFRRLCRHARSVGVLRYERRLMPGEMTPMNKFYHRLAQHGFKRCEIRGPKRIVVGKGWADDRTYLILSEMQQSEAV